VFKDEKSKKKQQEEEAQKRRLEAIQKALAEQAVYDRERWVYCEVATFCGGLNFAMFLYWLNCNITAIVNISITCVQILTYYNCT